MSIPGKARELIRSRTRLDQESLERLRASGALIEDDRRRRPLYFDGRFLAARDLTREQNYFLTRQADLGRANGAGVVAGLGVTVLSDRSALRIEAGHGLTRSGESVVLTDDRVIRLSDVAETQRLDATFGLLVKPGAPARNRTGLFILALRPVEFSAHKIAAYPTTITGERSTHDGDIVEALAVTLIPYRDLGGNGDGLERRRSTVARQLFVEGDTGGMPVDALPLAMVALERDTIRWLDVFMVRREVGADHGDVLGFGLAPRAVREAYMVQYDRHVREVLQGREATGRGRAFAAAEHFDALPAAGRMPVDALDLSTFTQTFFPPDVDVDLSIVPEDEILALVEESLLLPPIDLTLEGEALASTSVLVLVPRSLARVRTLRASLERLELPLRPAAFGMVARRSPLETLRGLTLARRAAPILRPEDLADRAWAAEVTDAASQGDGLLWYVRRRNLDYRSDVVGTTVRVTADEEDLETVMDTTMRDAGLVTRANALSGASTLFARPSVVSLLASPAVVRSPLLARAAVSELESAREKAAEEGSVDPNDQPVDVRSVARVSERFGGQGVGEGIRRLAEIDDTIETNRNTSNQLARSGLVPEIDRVAKALPEPDLRAFSAGLSAAGADPAALKRTIATFAGRSRR